MTLTEALEKLLDGEDKSKNGYGYDGVRKRDIKYFMIGDVGVFVYLKDGDINEIQVYKC